MPFGSNEHYLRYLAACEERYSRYIELVNLFKMLEDKADAGQVVVSDLVAVRCVIDSCVNDLDEILEKI